MTTLATIPQPLPVDRQLALMTSANRVGAVLDDLALAPDAVEALPVFAEANEALDQLSQAGSGAVDEERLDVARSLAPGRSFELGARHGMREVTRYFYVAVHPEGQPASDGESSPERYCMQTAEALASFDFGGAWALLGQLKQFLHEQDDEIDRGYFNGVLYALKRAVDSYRARLEGRLTDAQISAGASPDGRALAVLLFVGITRANRVQVTTTLGEEYLRVLDALDADGFISCIAAESVPPLRVTTEGIQEIYRLARELTL